MRETYRKLEVVDVENSPLKKGESREWKKWFVRSKRGPFMADDH